MHRYDRSVEFIVVYRRSTGELISVESFENGDAAVAALDIADGGDNDPDVETVLLGSTSFEALKVTHGRYFVRAPENLRPVAR